MKENKTVQVKCRLTESQKKRLEEYCLMNELNISEAIRLAIEELLGGKHFGE